MLRRCVSLAVIITVLMAPMASSQAGVSVPSLAGDRCDAVAFTPFYDSSIGRIVGTGWLGCEQEWEMIMMNTCIYPVGTPPATTSPHPSIQPSAWCTNKFRYDQSSLNGRHEAGCVPGLYVTYVEGWGVEQRGDMLVYSTFASDESPMILINCNIAATGAAAGSPEPSGEPSPEPSGEPSPEPSGEPSPEPSGEASPEPSGEASPKPSGEASPEPSGEPSPEPSP